MVFLKATLTDGSYHPVDASDIAFQLAAGLAFKEALPEAKPCLLYTSAVHKPRGEFAILRNEAALGLFRYSPFAQEKSLAFKGTGCSVHVFMSDEEKTHHSFRR